MLKQQSKASKRSPTDTADVHFRNKKEDALLRLRLDHISYRCWYSVSNIQREKDLLAKEHQRFLQQIDLSRQSTLNTLLKDIDSVNKNENSFSIGTQSVEKYKPKHACDVTSRSPHCHSVLSHKNLSQVFSSYSRRAVSSMSHMPHSAVVNELFTVDNDNNEDTDLAGNDVKLNKGPKKRPKSTSFLLHHPESTMEMLTNNQLKSISALDQIYQQEMERHRHLLMQEREKEKQRLEGILQKKINVFLKKLQSV
ncbi:uncharacterized protein LOC122794768 [Protopterus annectens]|uniref:uncharacterized protein LOC122794768 n=1 Tax=Protopterus annectens TaxID=7888 RepID=UPI001CF97C28|nr:uncharacterized protein LOC122794768 [Protopterus annectens]